MQPVRDLCHATNMTKVLQCHFIIKKKRERGGLWKEEKERRGGGGGVRALMLDTLMLLTGLSFEVYMYDSYFRNGE